MYVIAKVLGAVVVPSRIALVLVLLGVAVAILRPRRRLGVGLAAAGGVLLLVCSLPVMAGWLAAPLESRWAPYEAPAGSDHPQWIAVLGGGAGGGDDLPPTSRLAQGSVGRMVEGFRISRLLAEARVVVSGGSVERPSSTSAGMRDAMIDLGLDPGRVRVVDGARTTAEEVAGLQGLVGAEELVLVTSALHMPRAVYLTERAGLDVVPAPCDFLAWGRGVDRPWWGRWLPSASALVLTDAVAHERLGLLWARVVPGGRP